MGDATIDGISETRLSLVAESSDGVDPLVDGDLEQQLGHVTGTE